jgi:hypothetical protein
MSQGSPAHNLSIGHRSQPSDALSRDEELCIIHHYTTQTFKTFSRRDDESEVWRNEVFRDGPKYPFLLDLVIALAALHKAFTEPAEAEKYASASLYYQTQGLQAYQGQLMHINEENCHAVFAFSGMINGLNIAMSRGCASLPPTSPIDTLCLSLKLLRGVQLVLSTKLDVLMSTRYRAVLSPKDLQEETGTSEEVAAALQELREIVTDKPQLTTIGCAELYISTINSLEPEVSTIKQVSNQGKGTVDLVKQTRQGVLSSNQGKSTQVLARPLSGWSRDEDLTGLGRISPCFKTLSAV